MSDDPHRPELTPDELASAHVDGLATPDEVARIDADADLRARVARLQAARDAVRVPDLAPDTERRDAAIAAALAIGVPSAVEAPTDELAARRRRSTRRLGWVAAAAAAVALAVVLPRVIDRDHDGGDAAVVAAPKSADDDSAAGRSSTGAGAGSTADSFGDSLATEAAPDAGSTTTAYLPGPLANLGTVSDLEGLAEPARRALEGAPDATPSSSPSPEDTACLQDQAATATVPAQAGDEPPTVILSATASIDGQRALALVLQQPDGTRELVAFKADGCSLLGTIAL